MSQFQPQYPSDQAYLEPPRTSGIAIASLVCSILFCTAIVGVILGIIAIPVIAKNPQRKGMGFAVVGLFLGVVICIAQGAMIAKGIGFVGDYVAFVTKGPNDAIQAGFNDDIAGFKGAFHGDGASASDEEAQAFIDELRSRYGEFISCDVPNNANSQPQPGNQQPVLPFPYLITFDNETVDAEVELVFADELTGDLLKKFGSIIIYDSALGDLQYPADPNALPAVEDPADPPAETP